MNEYDKLREATLHECRDILDSLDPLLIELESDPASTDAINSIFRNIHTFKSSSAMLGYNVLERTVHLQEDLLDKLRMGEMEATTEFLDVLFESLDQVRVVFEVLITGDEPDPAVLDLANERLQLFLPASDSSVPVTASRTATDGGVDAAFIKAIGKKAKKGVVASVSEGRRLYQIIMKLDKDCFRRAIDPLTLIKGLRIDGEVVVVRADGDSIPHLGDMDPAVLYFGHISLLYATGRSMDDMHDFFEFALEEGDIDLHMLTPADLNEHFGIEVDSFWLEAPVEELAQGDATEEEAAVSIDAVRGELESDLRRGYESIVALRVDGSNEDNIYELFRFFHNVNGNCGILGIKGLCSVAEENEAFMEEVRSGNVRLDGASLDGLERAVGDIEELLFGDENGVYGKVADEKRDGEGGDRRVADAGLPGGANRRAGIDRRAPSAATAIRIEAERLDSLLDLVGELVITQSQVSQDLAAVTAGDARLEKNLQQFEKITKGIQDSVMSLRMLPLKGTFLKMGRVVRDAVKKTGKEVSIEFSGEDTEVDKTVIDEIGDPLTHLVRNSVDHGIEEPGVRENAGKERIGRIHLSARHIGGNVVIEVKDDGAGIDRKKILARALEKGIVEDIASVTDQEIFGYIFEPGFSTASTVTEISGRGVGLDVVKSNVERLRGKIDVVSDNGSGSAFQLRFPLTLASIEGMVVRVGEERYIIPTLSILGSVQPASGDITTVSGRGEVVNVRGKLRTLVRLHELFDTETDVTNPSESILVTVEGDGRVCCLMVDTIIGNQQVVIKSLGEGLGSLKGVSGCSILGDGRVGLILDVAGIIEKSMG